FSPQPEPRYPAAAIRSTGPCPSLVGVPRLPEPGSLEVDVDAAEPKPGVPATGVLTPYDRVLATVVLAELVSSTMDRPELSRVSSETFRTLVAPSTVEVSRVINQTTGQMASRTDSALAI